MIKIYKIEPNKGMSRICLECGERAFRHYQNRLDDMYDISCELSAGYDDLTDKFAVSQQKTQELHDRLYTMTQNIAHTEAVSIMTCGKALDVRYYDDLSTNDLLLIVNGRTIQDVSSFVAKRLAAMPGMLSTATHFILKRYKEDGVPLVDKKKDGREMIFG
jgi:alanyl-tRNA synthetase